MEKDEKMDPEFPGELLLGEFMKPLELSQNALARALKVPPRRINEIIHNRRRITADTALRLARYFGMTAQYWLNAQSYYDLEIARDELEDKILEEVQPRQNAA